MTRRSLMSGCGTMLLVLLPTIVSGQEHHRQHWLHITNTSNWTIHYTVNDLDFTTPPGGQQDVWTEDRHFHVTYWDMAGADAVGTEQVVRLPHHTQHLTFFMVPTPGVPNDYYLTCRW